MSPVPPKNPNFIGFVIPKIQDEGTAKGGARHSNQDDSGTESYKHSVSGTSSNESLTKKSATSSDLYYTIDDEPPWYLTLILGFQHYLTMAGSTVSVPFLLCPAMCLLEDDVGRAQIISTIMFISGIVTICQSTFGTRLPIIQGGSFSFIIPALAILDLPELKCPSELTIRYMRPDQRTELWQIRMREIQGAIIIASLTEVALGLFGIVGIILKYITPLTVAPAIAMIGLSLFKVSAVHASTNWGIALLTIVLIVLFSQYLRSLRIPIPFTKSEEEDGRLIRYPVFEVFPVLLTIALVWGLCGILTVTEVFSPTDKARTDVKLSIIDQSSAFRVPYPFQWGTPTISAGAVLGMTAGVIAGVVESIGDYYGAARISGAKPPPKHAINRGIFVEGVGCVLAGIFGTGNGTTSYSENIGAISVTKVGSRRVIQAAGILMILFSLVGKVGAVFISIPEPIIGGIFCIVFATVTAVGLSNLQGVNLNASRNIFIIGFSIFFGLTISQWVEGNKGVINTGVITVDQIITVLLRTGMFVSGFLGFMLDNTIPGTAEERGLVAWSEHLQPSEDSDSPANVDTSYDLPYVMDFIRRVSWLKYVPISPTFQGFDAKLPSLPKTVGRSGNKVSISAGTDATVISNANVAYSNKDRLKVYNVQ